MKHTLSLGILLAVLWLLLSGHFTPLMMTFGLVSVLVTLYLSRRMDVIDQESHPLHLTVKLFTFWLYLARKILIANVDVAARILGFKPIEPQLIKIPLTDCGDLSDVIYANSVTLTPGSASVHVEDHMLIVHTVSKEGAEELFSGEMASKIPQAEILSADQGPSQ